MSSSKIRLILLSFTILLTVLLFIAPRIAPKTETASKPVRSGSGADMTAGIEQYLKMAEKTLKPDELQQTAQMLSNKQNDSLVFFWDKRRRPDIAAYYTEAIAKAGNKPESWLKAGNRYYNAVQFCKDQTEIPLLYGSAMRCFSKALEMQPDNTEAKIMLASCYVEGTQDPMKGISMLREVEQKDSNNVKLQLSFAFFSIRSGQFDKAISRFEKVLKADSTYIEAYLHLADAYEQQGEKAKTIEMLEQYAKRTPDPMEKAELNKYIQQLKK